MLVINNACARRRSMKTFLWLVTLSSCKAFLPSSIQQGSLVLRKSMIVFLERPHPQQDPETFYNCTVCLKMQYYVTYKQILFEG